MIQGKMTKIHSTHDSVHTGTYLKQNVSRWCHSDIFYSILFQFQNLIFDPLNGFQNQRVTTPCILKCKVQEQHCPCEIQCQPQCIILNLLVATWKIKWKESDEIIFNNIVHLIHYIKILSFQHVITTENYWAILHYFLHTKSSNLVRILYI